MKIITIAAITDAGNKALKEHIESSKKMKLKEKMMFKAAGYKQIVMGEDPVEIELQVSGARFEQPMFLDLIQTEIKNALESNGAIVGKDYTIKIGK